MKFHSLRKKANESVTVDVAKSFHFTKHLKHILIQFNLILKGEGICIIFFSLRNF